MCCLDLFDLHRTSKAHAELPCSCQICPQQQKSPPIQLVPHQLEQLCSIRSSPNRLQLPARVELFDQTHRILPRNQEAPHPLATTKPASHCPCWFPLPPSASLAWPTWQAAYASPRLQVYVTKKLLSRASVWGQVLWVKPFHSA